MRARLVWLALALLIGAALATVPRFASPYIVALLLLAFMYITLASSWNLISGFTGYVSFGHVAFFGTGAYAGALLITRAHVPWPLASIAGGAIAAAIALPLGSIALRLKGPYFAIAMLGLAETFRIAASAWEPVTRGGRGIQLPPVLDLNAVFYAMGLTALTVVALTYVVATSKLGLRLLAIREDEVAAEVMGINTTLHKLGAFVLSAFFPGVVGGFYAWYVSYIDPDSVFSASITVRMIVMTVLGGAGTVLGPVLGGATISLVGEYLWTRFLFLHQAFLGVLIILVVLFLPGGVLSILRERGLLPRTRGY